MRTTPRQAQQRRSPPGSSVGFCRRVQHVSVGCLKNLQIPVRARPRSGRFGRLSSPSPALSSAPLEPRRSTLDRRLLGLPPRPRGISSTKSRTSCAGGIDYGRWFARAPPPFGEAPLSTRSERVLEQRQRVEDALTENPHRRQHTDDHERGHRHPGGLSRRAMATPARVPATTTAAPSSSSITDSAHATAHCRPDANRTTRGSPDAAVPRRA